MAEEPIFFNGIDALTGAYLQEPLVARELMEALRRSRRDRAEERELRWWRRQYTDDDPNRGPARGIDPSDLASSGWAVILPENPPAGVLEELAPLLEYRRAQATRRHEHYYRKIHYKSGETKQQFLQRLKVEVGPAHPDQLPYYLLLVGDPVTIPHRFQYLLDMQYAVGRLYFENPEDYGVYAHSVICAERGQSDVRPEVSFFSAHHSHDEASQRSMEHLVRPLAADLRRDYGHWQVRQVESATKSCLGRLLGEGETPALLFTFAHGLSFPCGHPDQPGYQGAILCQDWPGPRKRSGPISRHHYYAAPDISDDARVHGLIAIHLGCYSAGTPCKDNFPPDKAIRNPRDLAKEPFLARLPQRLLSHPNGGALAVLGHVDRIWSRTFGSGLGMGHHHIESLMKDLLDGYPVGTAMDWMNERFAELSTELTDVLDRQGEAPDACGSSKPQERRRLAALWRANNDARNFVVLGDPAAYLAAGPRAARGGMSVPQNRFSRRAFERPNHRRVLRVLRHRDKVCLRTSPAEATRGRTGRMI